MLKPAAARKRAQRAIPLGPCQRCGSTKRVQRHHDDLQKPLEVMLLCQICHKDRDMELGLWGPARVLAKKTCPVCGVEFQPRRAPQTTCKAMPCRRELGRRLARKRWDACRD